MRLGIIELKDSHSTLIHSLVNIYDFDENEIVIFTSPRIKEYLGDLETKGTLRYVIKTEEDGMKSFLATINNYKLDKAYITTFSETLSTLSRSRVGFPVSLFIHNIDEWKRRSPIQQIRNYIEEVLLHGLRQAGFQLKKQFIYPILRRKISDMVIDSGGKFVVLNSLLKEHLKEFIPGEKIDIIPFWVYDKKLSVPAIREDPSRLSICIPGKLSIIRRDYLNFFHFISEHLELFKENFELILLGHISPLKEEKAEKVIEAAESLKAKGFRIKSYTGFIPFQEYSRILSGSDILLGNVIVDLGLGKSYGLTKDSGVIYNMVHAAKPGFVPDGFQVADEFRDYITVYEDYDQLLEKLIKFKNDRALFARLQEKARKASEGFEPYQIYKRIEKKNSH
jgi:hypothetical protein